MFKSVYMVYVLCKFYYIYKLVRIAQHEQNNSFISNRSMSVTTTTTNSLLNLSQATQLGIDVSTRNAYQTTIVGYQAGPTNVGYFNCIFGYNAANKNRTGGYNVYLGTQCALNAYNSTMNVMVGNFAGQFLTSGNCNTMIGNYCGQIMAITTYS